MCVTDRLKFTCLRLALHVPLVLLNHTFSHAAQLRSNRVCDLRVSVPSSNGSANLAKQFCVVYDDPECVSQLDEISHDFSSGFFSLDLFARVAIRPL